jgi:hypothetical protein
MVSSQPQDIIEDQNSHGNQKFHGGNLPKGVGRNGIVFETKRPDDPIKYSHRFQDKIQERQKLIENESI